MTEDKITILIDFTEQTVPELDVLIGCPDHPTSKPEIGVGLAGGGYGVYTCCSQCGRVLSKTQEEDE